MADPAAQLAQLHTAGFEIRTYQRFPRAVAVIRRQVIALLEPTAGGLRMLGTPGWLFAESGGDAQIGVLVEENGRQVFRGKQSVVAATSDRVAELKTFREELGRILAGKSY